MLEKVEFPVTSIPAPKSVLGKISMCPSGFIKILSRNNYKF